MGFFNLILLSLWAKGNIKLNKMPMWLWFRFCKFFNYGSDSYGEDIAETESDQSIDYDTEDESDDDFIVGDLGMYPPSPIPNSGGIVLKLIAFLWIPLAFQILIFLFVAIYQCHTCQ